MGRVWRISDRVESDQHGEPFEEILGSEIECDEDVLKAICAVLEENDGYDPRDGEEPFYDAFMNYELIEEVEKRREQERADYYYEIDASLEDINPADKLETSLFFLERLVEEANTLDDVLRAFQLKMIFSFCITTLEAFLSDAFPKKVMNDETIKERYLRNERSLSGEKFALGDIFKRHRKIDATIKAALQNTSFHSLAYVKPLYKKVLDIDIRDIGELSMLINK